ncbi:hypothetical protein B0I35DRAFT_408511 [Stachybotrys elegans]|uniref:GDS1 winged helix domain-containing protein n=1 Tax=Stachybotrys elegans TaxID=80388 RepID=A0A8K0SSC2_9HYPO|nr:hypothetical protein B0I35DRAFT_408511 [Stachybotrys elegans]
MPYNTRRKSLSLPSLGIHIPVTHAARAAAASKNPSRPTSSPSSTPSTSASPSSRFDSPESHPSKRLKRSHGSAVTANDALATEQTPPPSPTPAASVEMSDADPIPKVDLEGINDNIVEAVITQLESTGNRPHLVKELETVLSQKLTVVQQSANPCAIISSRLSSYLKRTCWSAAAPCPLAKELETVHPRRTYFFLTTCPRQPLPEPGSQPLRASVITPSVSLTDDSGSDDAEGRRRELSPSPEVDLSPPEFDDMDDDVSMPMTPIGSFGSNTRRYIRHPRDLRRDSPPLEKDEREFTQTADFLQKRKLSDVSPQSDIMDRSSIPEYGLRDDLWFIDSRPSAPMTFLTSPSMKPTMGIMSSARKEDEAEAWSKLNKMFEWDKDAESIEIDELDCLLEDC